MIGGGPFALGVALDSGETSPEPRWQQGLYLSRQLYDHLGEAPLEIAAVHIERAFERAEIPIEIEVEYEPVEFEGGGDEPSGCGSHVFDQWLEADLPARNSNLCLVTHSGGGCAGVDDERAIAGADSLADVDHAFERGWSRVGHSIHSILHELAHNAGYRHEMATGDVDVRDGHYHVTPATSSADGAIEGTCGEPHPDIEHTQQVFHHYYSECTARLFQDRIGD